MAMGRGGGADKETLLLLLSISDNTSQGLRGAYEPLLRYVCVTSYILFTIGTHTRSFFVAIMTCRRATSTLFLTSSW